MALTEQDRAHIAKAEADHGVGRIAYAGTPKGLVICRAPTDGEVQRLTDKVDDAKKSNYSAQKEFVLGCRVHPESASFFDILQSYPTLVGKLAVALIDIGGADIEVETGKS